MNKKTSSHSSLFLLELMIAVFFFCIAAAVCVRFFVKSQILSQDTRNLDMAVNQTTAFAELFRSNHDFFDLIEEQCPDKTFSKEDHTITLYYSDNWTPCKENASAFSLEINIDETETICSGHFTVLRSDTQDEIFSLETKKYIEEEILP